MTEERKIPETLGKGWKPTDDIERCPVCNGRLYGFRNAARHRVEVMCFSCGFRMGMTDRDMSGKELSRALREHRDLAGRCYGMFGELGITPMYPDKDMAFGPLGPTALDLDEQTVATRAQELIDRHLDEVEATFIGHLEKVPEESRAMYREALNRGYKAVRDMLGRRALGIGGEIVPLATYLETDKEEIE